MDSIYNRYALGLFSIAEDENKVEIYKDEIKNINILLKENEDLIHLFSSYFINQYEKEKCIDKIFGEFQIYTQNFLKLIIKNNRINKFNFIAKEFNKLCNDYLNIKEGIIYSTEALSKEQIKKVEDKLSEVINTKVELTNQIDEKLIGGIKVIVDEKVFDGSIKNKLEKLKSTLISGGI